MVMKKCPFMVVNQENGGEINMPIYEYKCDDDDCEKITEVFDKISETTKMIKCSSCGHPASKIFSLSSVHTKRQNEVVKKLDRLGKIDLSTPEDKQAFRESGIKFGMQEK